MKKKSKEGHLQGIRRGGSECQEDQLQALGSKQDTVFNATYEHEPQLPGIKGQTEAIYGRLWSRADPVYNATYDNDPQLPGIQGQTELIKLRIDKRLRSESRVYEAEAGPPVKKFKKTST